MLLRLMSLEKNYNRCYRLDKLHDICDYDHPICLFKYEILITMTSAY